MPKEDYLLLFLEKLSRVVAAMLGFRDKGYPEDAIRLADEAYTELLKLNVEELKIMPLESFVALIVQNGYSVSYIEGLSGVLVQTAHALGEQDKAEEANGFYLKALHLNYLLNEKDKTYSFEREMKISELKQLIH